MPEPLDPPSFPEILRGPGEQLQQVLQTAGYTEELPAVVLRVLPSGPGKPPGLDLVGTTNPQTLFTMLLAAAMSVGGQLGLRLDWIRQSPASGLVIAKDAPAAAPYQGQTWRGKKR